jgi:hypothetical protein
MQEPDMPIGTDAVSFPARPRRRAPLASAAAALAVLFQWACGSGNTPSTPPTCAVNGVTVSANPTTVNTGVTATLLATVTAGSSCTGGVTWSATPAGGTLTPNGLTATFSAAAAGTYTVRATSTDDPTRSGTATLTVTASAPPCGQPDGTVVTHTANVGASETWAGDGVTHLVPNTISITGNASVTIQPCAIVALGAGVSIAVRDNARLVAAGTGSARFILFRRNVANQAWGTLRGLSPTSLIDLTWTTLQGGGAFGSMNDPTIAVAGTGYGSPTSPVLRTSNVTVQGSQGVGVYLDANGAFTSDSQILQITGSGSRPVVTTMMSLGSLPSGTYTGNATDEILIAGPSANVFGDMTVEDRGVPVRIAYGAMFIGPAVGATAPVTLTLRPGVIFKFPRLGQQAAPGTRVTFGTNGSAPNNLVGVLNAIGTAAKPIVFTSGELLPAPGDWVGLWLNTANGSRLDYVEILYAGAPSGIQSNNCRPINTPDNAALLVGSFSTQYVPPGTLLTNSRITSSAGYAINAMWQAGTFNGPDLTATNIFQNNARCTQTYNGLVPPGVCPVGGGCTAN